MYVKITEYGLECPFISLPFICTGKSFSEALILASLNPQYDERLFIELQEKYKFRTRCVQKLVMSLFWHSKRYFYTTCSELVFFNSMNNLSSYCGLTDSRMRASDTDLPVCRLLYHNYSFCWLFTVPKRILMSRGKYLLPNYCSNQIHTNFGF